MQHDVSIDLCSSIIIICDMQSFEMQLLCVGVSWNKDVQNTQIGINSTDFKS